MTMVGQVVDCLERFAPLRTAAAWDNVGLLLGDRADPAERMMTCLTVTPEVVVEAVAERVQMIVSHHPILFKGAKNLSTGTAEGRLLAPLMKAGIAVYSPHTAFDNCPGGINDTLAESFGLTDVRPLRSKPGPDAYKIAFFAPEKEVEKVCEAMFEAGAGTIGNYDRCSFRTLGIGTFRGGENTNPTIGTPGVLETVEEIRVEVIVAAGKLAKAVAALRGAHSYEEPAIDVYKLDLQPEGGEGRIGTLSNATTLEQFAGVVKAACGMTPLGIVGEPTKPIRTVAVACGAAGEFLNDAIKLGADAFVTGEMRFHDLLAAEAAGIAVILPGHYGSERPGVEALAARLAKDFPGTTVWASRAETDPLRLG